jgi:hypothetical protein
MTHASAKRCRLWFSAGPHPDEVAADKTLALFGRAAARDLVDVAALSERRWKAAVRAGPENPAAVVMPQPEAPAGGSLYGHRPQGASPS